MTSAGTSIALVDAFLCTHVLLVAVAALLMGLRSLNRALSQPMTYRHLLMAARALSVVALTVPILALWHGGSQVSPLKAQIWAGPSMTVGTLVAEDDSRIAVGSEAVRTSLAVSVAQAVALLALGGGLALVLVPALTQLGPTLRSVRGAHVLRTMGSLSILVSDTERVPFALWLPTRSLIVLPSSLLLNPDDVRMVLRHEGEHHRQGDTRYVYLALVIRAIFGANPAVHWLMHQLNELQELACDEAVARRPDHCNETYCGCLLRVAESAVSLKQSSLRAFMANREADVLKRRIEAAVRSPGPRAAPTAAMTITVTAVLLLSALSVVIATPVRDRRISRTDAQQLVATTPESATWGLRANEAVLRQLNLLLGTPDGRAFLTASIARMRGYETSVRSELNRFGLPSELAVVPLVESGYQNHRARKGIGAGLWMFIGSTARYYGLQVAAGQDQRLDAAAETHAAMVMFSQLENHFQNWPLALLAYNAGVAKVEAGIAATHSRDAWILSDAGYGNDPDYLARTAAVMVVLAHPQLLN